MIIINKLIFFGYADTFINKLAVGVADVFDAFPVPAEPSERKRIAHGGGSVPALVTAVITNGRLRKHICTLLSLKVDIQQ